jgi:hypothetical protein
MWHQDAAAPHRTHPVGERWLRKHPTLDGVVERCLSASNADVHLVEGVRLSRGTVLDLFRKDRDPYFSDSRSFRKRSRPNRPPKKIEKTP